MRFFILVLISSILWVPIMAQARSDDYKFKYTPATFGIETCDCTVDSWWYWSQEAYRRIEGVFRGSTINHLTFELNTNLQRLLELPPMEDQGDDVSKSVQKAFNRNFVTLERIKNELNKLSKVERDKLSDEDLSHLITQVVNQYKVWQSLEVPEKYDLVMERKSLSLLSKIIELWQEERIDIDQVIINGFENSAGNDYNAFKNYDIWLNLDLNIDSELFLRIDSYFTKTITQLLLSETASDLDITAMIDGLDINDIIGLYILNHIGLQQTTKFSIEGLQQLTIWQDEILGRLQYKLIEGNLGASIQLDTFLNQLDSERWQLVKKIQPYAIGQLQEVIVYNEKELLERWWEVLQAQTPNEKLLHDIFKVNFTVEEVALWQDLYNYVALEDQDQVEAWQEFYYDLLIANFDAAKEDNLESFELEKWRFSSGEAGLVDILYDIRAESYRKKPWYDLLDAQLDHVVYNLLNTNSIDVLKHLEMTIYENDDIWNQVRVRVKFLSKTIRDRKIELDEKTKQILDLVDEFDEKGMEELNEELKNEPF